MSIGALGKVRPSGIFSQDGLLEIGLGRAGGGMRQVILSCYGNKGWTISL